VFLGEENGLTFIDGIMLCKHIYQCAVDKTLNGVIEQEQIFYKVHDMLRKLGYNVDNKQLDEILYKLNIDDIYALI